MKFIFRKSFFLFIGLSLFASSLVKAQQEEATDDGTAKVYFFCNTQIPVKPFINFFMDNEFKCKVHYKKFKTVSLAPGEYSFGITRGGVKKVKKMFNPITKNLKAGKVYYFIAISTMLNGAAGAGMSVDSEIIEVTPEYANNYVLNFYKEDEE